MYRMYRKIAVVERDQLPACPQKIITTAFVSKILGNA